MAEAAVEEAPEEEGSPGEKIPEPAKPSPAAEKLKKIRDLMKKDQLKAKKKDNSISSAVRFLGDETIDSSVEFIPTGSMNLDTAMGGGWPLGRIVEVFGPEASGKTTVALHAVANVQSMGKVAMFIDMEQALDTEYAKEIGVNLDELAFIQPNSAEEALDKVEEYVRNGAVDLVVVDSVAALVPQEELDKDFGQQTIGLLARLMSKAMRKLAPMAQENNCCLMFINQVRMKIGQLYGNPETTPGGKALPFQASMRLEVRSPPSARLGPDDNPYGALCRAKVVKNKVAPPHKKAEFTIIYGKGISKDADVISSAEKFGIVKQKGAWFELLDENGEKINQFQGRDKLSNYVSNNPEVAADLEMRCREALGKKSGSRV